LRVIIILFNFSFRFISKDQDFSDPLSFDRISYVDEWIRPSDLYTDEYGNSDWMILDPSSVNTMLLRPLSDEAEESDEGKLHVLRICFEKSLFKHS